jgi:hypothetical protein
MNIAPYAKAATGAVVTGLTALSQALDDGGVSAQEWIGVAIATLVGTYAIWQIPNRDPEAKHQDESVQPPDAGFVATEICLAVIAVGVVLYLLFGANWIGR